MTTGLAEGTLDILVADDEAPLRVTLKSSLVKVGHRVVTAGDCGDALAWIARRRFDVVICDVGLQPAGGLDIFRQLHTVLPETDLILTTASGCIADAVSALKKGASDYLSKPYEIAQLLDSLSTISSRRNLRKQLAAGSELSPDERERHRIVGRSPAMGRLNERLETFSGSDAPVLVTGESGTGKELVARTLHDRSKRRDKPFIAVNCAAFPETLIEAELFGHERGAFTGAVKRREGRFHAAQGGTIFLDEVTELAFSAQAKLLRVLQEGTFEPLGTNKQVPMDVRVISASNSNVKERIAAHEFREDLYFRLKVLDIEIPPLRHRRGDLPILVEHFLRMFAGPHPKGLTARAWAALADYPFPGNVRELEHAIHHGAVLAKGAEIDLRHLPSDIAGLTPPSDDGKGGFRTMASAVAEFEREYVLRAMRAAEGKKTLAASLLGVSRKTLWERLRAMNNLDTELLSDPEPTEPGRAAPAPKRNDDAE